MKFDLCVFLNSKIVLLIIGFLLTGVLGKHLTEGYQDALWERDKKYEVFKQEVEEAKKSLDEVNFHISSRIHGLQKVHWELENNDLNGAENQYKRYIEIKDSWNKKIRIYRNKLKRLVDVELAYALQTPEAFVGNENKESVHYHFIIAHNKTKFWLSCLRGECGEAPSKKEAAQKSLQELYRVTDEFIDESYMVFLMKYKNLQENPTNT